MKTARSGLLINGEEEEIFELTCYYISDTSSILVGDVVCV